jgi:hypothetical protein
MGGLGKWGPVALQVAIAVVVVGCGGSEFSTQTSGSTTGSTSATTAGTGGASIGTGSGGGAGGGAIAGSGGRPSGDAAIGSEATIEASANDARDARSDASTNARCPPIEPTASSACAEGLDCTYGTHPRLACRHEYRCLGAHWTPGEPGMACPALSDCAIEQPKLPQVGASCPTAEHDCIWSSGLYCRCLAAANDAGSPTWDCYPPPQGCPTTPLNKGQTCDLSVMTCAYGTCPLGTKVTTSCVGAVVTWTVACP